MATGWAVFFTTKRAPISSPDTGRIRSSDVPVKPRTSAGNLKMMRNSHKSTTLQKTLMASAGLPPAPSTAAPATPATPARQLVTTYCVTCHNERLKTGNLMLNKADSEQVFNSAETWEKVVVKLRSRAMPPAGSRRPDNATYDGLAAWLERELDRAAAAHLNPGRPAD